MASALDKITQARPRSVGVDIIYTEPSAPEEDRRLAEAIARNGRVVLPTQLFESESKDNSTDNSTIRTVSWLRPLPEFAAATKAVGHAHVSSEIDGMAQSIQLSKADDRADRLWAFGLEVVRAAEQIPAEAIEEQTRLLRFGDYRIPVRDEAMISTIPGVEIVRRNEMLINYAGPAGSFRYYSIADLIDGKVPLSALTDKIVLIGAVAESMGDTRVAPFMHYSSERNGGGREMPGVEIHANIINNIRSRLSFRPLPDESDEVLEAAREAYDAAILAGDLAAAQAQATIIANRTAELTGAKLLAKAQFSIGALAVLKSGGQFDLLVAKFGDDRVLSLVESLIGHSGGGGRRPR